METSTRITSYIYDLSIDHKKLKKDIEEVLKGNYELQWMTKKKKNKNEKSISNSNIWINNNFKFLFE